MLEDDKDQPSKGEIEEIILKRAKANGRKGGKNTLTKYGVSHFTKIGKKGAQATKKLWREKRKVSSLPTSQEQKSSKS